MVRRAAPPPPPPSATGATARARRLVVRVLAGLAAVVVVLVGVASPAAAHASLVSADPPDGSSLPTSPARVTLTFSERVSAELGGVRVLDANGQQVQVGAARVDGNVVTIDVQPDLPEGTYVVSYRVVSADGHPVRGGTVFGVGEAPVDTTALGRVASISGDRPWEVAGAIGRWLAYAGVLVASGAALFLARVHREGEERTQLIGLVGAAGVVGAVGSLVALPVQAALGTGQGPGSLFDDGVLAEVIRDGVGLALVLALGGVGLLMLTAPRSPRIALLGAIVGAASFAATGHTRALPEAAVATAIDAVHLLAAAVWTGGLASLWWTLRARRHRGGADPVETAAIVGRFSELATISIVVAGIAGLALSWSEVQSMTALLDTRYGLLLTAKVLVVVAVAALGAYNHFVLVPALRRGAGGSPMGFLRRTVQVEIVGIGAVLAVTSVLVVTTPARDSVTGGVVERVIELGDAGSVQLIVSPARAGFNEVHVYTYDLAGRPAEIAEAVTVELELPAASLGPIDREATRAGPAHFQADGSDFAIGGDWQVTIRLRLDRFNEAAGTTQVPIAG